MCVITVVVLQSDTDCMPDNQPRVTGRLIHAAAQSPKVQAALPYPYPRL